MWKHVFLYSLALVALVYSQSSTIATLNYPGNLACPAQVSVAMVDGATALFTVEVTCPSGTTPGWVGLAFPQTPATMIGSDAVIGFLSQSVGVVNDYKITAKQQCSGSTGVCPDTAQGGVYNLVNPSFTRNGQVSTLQFTRALNTGDAMDIVIGAPGTTQNILVAVGSSDTLAYHGGSKTSGSFVVPTPGSNNVNCAVSAFGAWGPCNVNCGGGTQVSTRTITTQPQGSGASCPALQQVQTCNVQACTDSICAHTQLGLIPWSKWSGKPTSAGQNVDIPAGTLVLLDVSPGFVLGVVTIEGQLVFNNVGTLSLQAARILVNDGGRFFAGSEACPLSNQIEIVLWDVPQNPYSDPPLELANKVLGAFDGGQIDIHGVPNYPTWTMLGQSASVGDSHIILDTSVTWKVGQSIVIVSTDYTQRGGTDPNDLTDANNCVQDEVVTIASVTALPNGQTNITFLQPLIWNHYGKNWTTPDGLNTIDMRGEVGLLSRNILFHGDVTQPGTLGTDGSGWGAHIMSQGPRSQMRIAGVELTNVGQSLNKGRYPLHFHQCGNQPNSYIKDNAVHHSFQRGTTLHGTNNVLVKNNVYYDVMGHVCFIEDGNEELNIFDHNLVSRANPFNLLVADKDPAAFWTTNPNNTWINNVAVSASFGWWFALPTNPLGLAPAAMGGATSPQYLSYLNCFKPIQLFNNNKAHSMARDGLHIDDGQQDDLGNTAMTSYNPINWQPYINATAALYLVTQPHGWRPNQLQAEIWNLPLGQGLITNFVAYKCVQFGIWGRGEGMVIENTKIADCQIGCQFPGQNNIFDNGIIVGETDNFGTSGEYWVNSDQGRARFYRWDPQFRILGYRHYDGGSPDIVRNTIFYNFIDTKFLFSNLPRKAGAIGIMPGQSALPSENRYMNLKFVNTLNHVYFEAADFNWQPNHFGTTIHDVDGSITGACGSEITYAGSPILSTPNCVFYPLWNATVCPPGGNPHRYTRIEDHTGATFLQSDPLQIQRSYLNMYRVPDLVEHTISSYWWNGVASSTADRRGFTANLMTNTAYVVVFGIKSETPAALKVGFQNGVDGEWIRFGIPFPAGTTFTTDDNRTPVTSFAAMNSTTYFFDSTAGLLWLDCHAINTQFYEMYGHTYSSSSVYSTITATCPGGVCTSPYIPNQAYLSQMPVPPTTTQDICEITGSMIGGDVVYTETPGAPEYVLYSDSMPANWQTNGDFDSTVAYGGSGSSIRFNVSTSNRGLQIYRAWQDRGNVVPVTPYTHLTFKVMKQQSSYAGAIPKMSLQIYAVDLNWAGLGGSVYVDTPFNNPTFPIDDRPMWHQVYVPLSAIGLTQYNNLVTFVIVNSDWDWQQNFTFWVDDLKMASFSGSLVTNPAEVLNTTNVDTSFNYATAPRPSTIPTECPSVCPVGQGASSLHSAIAAGSSSYNGNASTSLPGWVVPVIAIMGACIVALIVVVAVLKVNQSKRLVSEYA